MISQTLSALRTSDHSQNNEGDDVEGQVSPPHEAE